MTRAWDQKPLLRDFMAKTVIFLESWQESDFLENTAQINNTVLEERPIFIMMERIRSELVKPFVVKYFLFGGERGTIKAMYDKLIM